MSRKTTRFFSQERNRFSQERDEKSLVLIKEVPRHADMDGGTVDGVVRGSEGHLIK